MYPEKESHGMKNLLGKRKRRGGVKKRKRKRREKRLRIKHTILYKRGE